MRKYRHGFIELHRSAVVQKINENCIATVNNDAVNDVLALNVGIQIITQISSQVSALIQEIMNARKR